MTLRCKKPIGFKKRSNNFRTLTSPNAATIDPKQTLKEYLGISDSFIKDCEQLCLSKKTKYSLKYVLTMNRTRLRRKTRFNTSEVEVLIQIFWTITQRTMEMSYDQLTCFLFHTFNYNVPPSLRWRGYERIASEMIKVDEFLRMMHIILRGNRAERSQFAFEIWDYNGDGYIDIDEFETLMKNIFFVPSGINDTSEDGGEGLNQIMIKKLKNVYDINQYDGISMKRFFEIVDKIPLLEEGFFQITPEEKYVRLFEKLVLSTTKR